MKIETHKHSAEEVAKSLGISRTTLYRWEKIEGFPAALKIGPRRTRYDLDLIKAFLSEAGRSLPAIKSLDEIKIPSEEPDPSSMNIAIRDYFAAKALQGMLTTSGAPALLGLEGCEYDTAKAAYKMADAMLLARSE